MQFPQEAVCLPFPGRRLERLRKPGEIDARDRCDLIWSTNGVYRKTFGNPQRYTGMGAVIGRAETKYHPKLQSRAAASQRVCIMKLPFLIA